MGFLSLTRSEVLNCHVESFIKRRRQTDGPSCCRFMTIELHHIHKAHPGCVVCCCSRDKAFSLFSFIFSFTNMPPNTSLSTSCALRVRCPCCIYTHPSICFPILEGSPGLCPIILGFLFRWGDNAAG